MRLSPGKVQNYPQETLGDIVRDIIRRQIAICLAVWLAIIVPISCEHHVVMTLADYVDTAVPQHDHQVSAALSQHLMSMSHNATDNSLCSLDQHDTAPRAMMLLTLFDGVLPITIRLQAPVNASTK